MATTRSLLRRLARGLALWLVLPTAVLVGVRLYWQWHEDRALAEMIASLRSRGIMTAVESLPDAAGIAAGENAVEVLFTGALQWLPGEDTLLARPVGRLTPAQGAAVLKVIDGHPDLLLRIDAAGACPVTRWPREMFTDPEWMRRHSAAGWATAARLLAHAAMAEHGRGDDLLALGHLRRMLVVVDVLEQSPVWIHSHLAQVFRTRLAEAVEALAPGLAMEQAQVQAAAGRLALALADDRQALKALALAGQGEIVHIVRMAERPDLWGEVPWMQRPLLTHTLAGWLRGNGRLLEAAGAANWPEYERRTRRMVSHTGYSYREQMLDLGDQLLSRAFVQDSYFRRAKTLAHTRAGAMLVAARVFGAQRGRLPVAAEELVPGLLSHVPVDPLADPAAPMRYRLSAADYPVVWSVGEDNVDDGGGMKDMLFPAAAARGGGGAAGAGGGP